MITTIASIEEAIGKSKVLVGRCISRGPGTKPSTCKQRLLLQKKFNSCHWKKCFEMLKKLNKKKFALTYQHSTCVHQVLRKTDNVCDLCEKDNLFLHRILDKAF
jgi:hypothetical protein